MIETYLVHEDPRSGNCYKIKLTAALLGIAVEQQQYDILRGETRTPEFLSNINRNGRIPVLQINRENGSKFLPESNAACWYLASRSELIPSDRFAQADMLRWMFFEQYKHEPTIATLRYWLSIVGEANLSEQQRSQIMAKRIAGCDALQLMDEHLTESSWIAGDKVTLADIVLFPYTHVAEEGGFGLEDYSHVCAWIERVQTLDGFVPMG